MYKLIAFWLLAFCFLGCEKTKLPHKPPTVCCTTGILMKVPSDFDQKKAGVLDVYDGATILHVTVTNTTQIVLHKATRLEDLLDKQIIVCGEFDGDEVRASSVKEL